MIPRRGLLMTAATSLAAACVSRARGASAPGGPVRLLVRGDDMGSAEGANRAVIHAFTHGIVRSAEVIVPAPWFPDAVRLLKQHPGLDVGVHLALTSEWDRLRWRPLTHAPTLVDADGYLPQIVRSRTGYPAGAALLDREISLVEVERELRAQIEMLRRHVPRTSHVSAHMGATGATPQLRELVTRLCAEYGLISQPPGLRSFDLGKAPGGAAWLGSERERQLIARLETLPPGDHLFVEHPATDDPELRALGHPGYTNVAAERSAVTASLTSRRVREVIERRGIRLVSYLDLAPPRAT